MTQITLHNYESFLLDLSEGTLNAADREALRLFLLSHPGLVADQDNLFLPLVPEKNIRFEPKEVLKKTTSDIYHEDLLNYVENNLSSEETAAFKRQLDESPILREELAHNQKTIVEADADLVYSNKLALLRTEEELFKTELYQQIAYVEGIMSEVEKNAFERNLKENAELHRSTGLLFSMYLEADESVIFPHKEHLKKRNKVIFLFDSGRVAMMAAAILLLFGFYSIFNFYTRVEQKMPGSQPGRNQISAKSPQSSRYPAALPNSEKKHGTLREKHENSRTIQRKARTSEGLLEKSTAPTHVAELAEPRAAEKGELLANQEPLVQIPEEIKSDRRNAEVENTGNQSYNTAQFYSLPVEEDTDIQFDVKPAVEGRTGFWKKAVAFAKQANRMGIKSVDGEENMSQNYRLTFNNMSVERR